MRVSQRIDFADSLEGADWQFVNLYKVLKSLPDYNASDMSSLRRRIGNASVSTGALLRRAGSPRIKFASLTIWWESSLVKRIVFPRLLGSLQFRDSREPHMHIYPPIPRNETLAGRAPATFPYRDLSTFSQGANQLHRALLCAYFTCAGWTRMRFNTILIKYLYRYLYKYLSHIHTCIYVYLKMVISKWRRVYRTFNEIDSNGIEAIDAAIFHPYFSRPKSSKNIWISIIFFLHRIKCPY